jgi:hypothetical protein
LKPIQVSIRFLLANFFTRQLEVLPAQSHFLSNIAGGINMYKYQHVENEGRHKTGKSLVKVYQPPNFRFGLMLLSLSIIFLLLSANAFSAQSPDDYGDRLGTVKFEVSCNLEAQRLMARGLALTHHMTYSGARRVFEAAAQADGNCAMAYWGQAMSLIHPLWSDAPSEEVFKKGQALLKEARARGPKTEREKAYIAAVEAYFAVGKQKNEKPNLVAFEKGWAEVHRRFPDDLEAASFYALSHMAIADPSDKTYAKQKKAAEIAQMVKKKIPDHPGAHHYIIHAYDYPPLAILALPTARNYGNIAPAVPHALHMPSHIFTRLGYWPESITMNLRSAAAALKHPARGMVSLHYVHAMDYMAYAHLQRG